MLPLPYKKSRVCYFFFTIDCRITTWICAVRYMFVEWKRWSDIAADKRAGTRLNLHFPINCRSAAASLAHHLLHASSWFEWLFVFPFSQPAVSQRHRKYLYAIKGGGITVRSGVGWGAQSEEIIETRLAEVFRAWTAHGSVTGNWGSEINVFQMRNP